MVSPEEYVRSLSEWAGWVGQLVGQMRLCSRTEYRNGNATDTVGDRSDTKNSPAMGGRRRGGQNRGARPGFHGEGTVREQLDV